MVDGIATEAPTEAPSVQPPGPVADSLVELSPQSPPIIPSMQPSAEPPVTAEVAPVQEISLRDIYAKHAARYRELGRKQLDGVLSVEERREREDLNQMAGFGMFDVSLSEEQLKTKDAARKALIDAEAIELKDPQQLAEEYRRLGLKHFDQGLKAEELVRYDFLDMLRKKGKFELPQAA